MKDCVDLPIVGNGDIVCPEDAQRMIDIKQIQVAMELYITDYGQYPQFKNIALGDGAYRCLGSTGFELKSGDCPNAISNFLPTNPSPGGSDYVYSSIGSNSFGVDFTFEVGVEGYRAGEHCATHMEIKKGSCF